MPLTKEEIAKIEEEERVRAEARSKHESHINKKEKQVVAKRTSVLTWIFAVAVILAITSFIIPSFFGPLAFVIILFFIYFLPTIIGFENKKKNAQAIFALNLFLGWTLIGWVIALTWSYTKD